MAALIGATGLGDKIWQFIPWAWPVRLAMLPGVYLQFMPDMLTRIYFFGLCIESAGNWPYSGGNMPSVALVGGMVWFDKWEEEFYE